jgi:hypothetical protein
MQCAIAHAYKNKDDHHLYGDGDNAQQSAYETMSEIGECQFIEQATQLYRLAIWIIPKSSRSWLLPQRPSSGS